MGAPIAQKPAQGRFRRPRLEPQPRQSRCPSKRDGITIAATPAEAATDADFVLTMLIDGDAVENTMVDGGGLAAMRDDAVWLQCSTVGVEAIERLAALASKANRAFVDAPVSRHEEAGRRRHAHRARSRKPRPRTTMPTGLRCDRRTRTIWLDEVGQASKLKLVVNSWVLGSHRWYRGSDRPRRRPRPRPATVPRHGERLGDRQPVPARQGRSDDQARLRRPPSRSPARYKDIGLILAAAEAAGISHDVMTAVQAKLERTVQLGLADKDMAAMYLATAK